MTPSQIYAIHAIQGQLHAASKLADREAANETDANDSFTFLAQLIDYALARAETIIDNGS